VGEADELYEARNAASCDLLRLVSFECKELCTAFLCLVREMFSRNFEFLDRDALVLFSVKP
jgi:hypothetical protein